MNQSRKKKLAKRRRKKIARAKAKRVSTVLAISVDGKLRQCNWFGVKPPELYNPTALIGIIVDGKICLGSRKTGKVFVDL